MKVDLSGYPRPVRPRRLGLYTRLVAVADGYDAATTRRAYQSEPWEPDAVLKEMWMNPGRGYDPTLVKALINLLGIYPVGTCVILDSFEVAIVCGSSPDPEQLHRPLVRIAMDANGARVPPPGTLIDLSIPDVDGIYPRTIVKVTTPNATDWWWVITSSESKLDRCWAALRAGGRTGLVPYLTAGFPTFDQSLAALRAVDPYSDVIEVGVPFSDPLADGPTIQASTFRALANGMTLPRTLDLIAEARLRSPVVLFSYVNPILQYGVERLLRDAADLGIAGTPAPPIFPPVPMRRSNRPSRSRRSI